MDDLNYKIGSLESQMSDVRDLTETLQKDVSQIKTQLADWRSTAVGALAVLSTIGAVLLYFADGLIEFLKVKLGF